MQGLWTPRYILSECGDHEVWAIATTALDTVGLTFSQVLNHNRIANGLHFINYYSRQGQLLTPATAPLTPNQLVPQAGIKAVMLPPLTDVSFRDLTAATASQWQRLLSFLQESWQEPEKISTCHTVEHSSPGAVAPAIKTPDEKFVTWESGTSADDLPSEQQAKRFLLQQGVEVDQCTGSHLCRAAWVLQRVQTANPDWVNRELPEQYQKQLRQVLCDFQDVCAFGFADLSEPAKVQPFHILTGDAPPVAARYFRQSAPLEDFLRAEIQLNVQKGLLVSSQSNWAAAMFAVPKPVKPGYPRGYRMVADYRKLNLVTVADRYPLPLIEQLFEEIGHSRYFHANDLQSGFWQVPMDPASQRKTAVSTRWGLYEYTRMPQGVRNAPAHFMRVVNEVFNTFNLHTGNVAFVDDVTSHGASFEASVIHLRNALSAFREVHLAISPLKARWGYTKLQLLGHVVQQGSIAPQPQKVAAIAQLPCPQNVDQLRSFLGVVGYYRQYIPNFGAISAPLYSLLKKGQDWLWSAAHEESFRALRQALVEEPVLHVPEPDAPFILYTDWSKDAVSAILHQKVRGEEKVIAYASKSCDVHQRNYSPTKGELLALVFGVTKFRQYLYGNHFTAVVDHSALQHLATAKQSATLQRWGVFLSEFDFSIVYKPGKSHSNADGLSRLPALTDTDFQLQIFNVQQLQACLAWPGSCAEATRASPGSCPEAMPSSDRLSFLTLAEVSACDTDGHLCVTGPGCTPPAIQHLQQELLNTASCSICGEDPDGHRQQLVCDGCNRVAHVTCLGLRKVPSTFYFCEPCLQRYRQGGQYDLAFDVQFQQWCLGSRAPHLLSRASYFEALLKEGYFFQGGQLYRDLPAVGRRVIPPPAGRVLVLEEVHTRHGHLGISKTFDLVSSMYWWPALWQDTSQFISHCLQCQLQKAVYHRESQLQHLALPEGPRQVWHIDLAPDLPSADGIRQLIIAQDHFSKFLLLGVLPNRTSAAVAQWFQDHIVAVFGVPLEVRTDLGSEFKGDFHAMLAGIKTSHVQIPAEAPWSNGVAERSVRTSKDSISRIAVMEGELHWPEYLPNIALGYNGARHSSTGVTPFQLMFGAKPRLVVDEQHFPHLPERHDPAAYLTALQTYLQRTTAAAAAHRAAYFQQSRKDYAAAAATDGCLKRVPQEFQPGQLVAIRRQTRTRLGVHSLGPFLVVATKGHHVTVRSLSSAQTRTEHRVNVVPLNLEWDLQGCMGAEM